VGVYRTVPEGSSEGAAEITSLLVEAVKKSDSSSD